MIAICIGHSRGDGGAVSVGGMNEWNYNRKLGGVMLRDLRERGHEVMLVDRYAQAGYSRAMDYLVRALAAQRVTVAVELHFNSSERKEASGHEWLHWHTSHQGRKLGRCLEGRMAETFPEMKRRGLKAISGAERGGLFLQKTQCPAVICEPFFGSNEDDWLTAMAHRDLLARVMADGIDDWKGAAV